MTETIIRIDHNDFPHDGPDPDQIAEIILERMGEVGIKVDASYVFSHIKIELQTAHLAAACVVLVDMNLIPARGSDRR